jgi:spore maturation protein CgeB
MKKLIAAIIATAFVASFVASVYAEDAAKEQTIKGEALCAKCELHETDKCQTAIRVKEDGKDVVYYADNNDVAKKFHKSICQAPAKVTATGTVEEKDG